MAENNKVIEMKQEDFDLLVTKLGEKASTHIKEQIEAGLKEKADLGEVNNLKSTLSLIEKIDDKPLPDYLKNLQTQADNLEAKLKDTQKNIQSRKGFIRQAEEFLTSTDLKAFKTKGSKERQATTMIDVKDVGDMSLGDNLLDSDGAAGMTPPITLRRVTETGRTRPFLLELIPTAFTESGVILDYEETGTGEGSVGQTAEMAKFSQKDYDFVQKQYGMVKTTVYTRVSREMVEDIGFLVGKIQNVLMRDFRIAVDQQILKGTGSNNQVKGLTSYAEAFDNDDWTADYGKANLADIVSVASDQIAEEHYSANYALFRPKPYGQLIRSRGTDGHYLVPPFQSGPSIAGINAIINTGVDSGKFFVGDFNAPNIWIRRGIEFGMKEVGEDALYDAVTLLMSMRWQMILPGPLSKAFVQGDIETALNWLNYNCATCPTG